MTPVIERKIHMEKKVDRLCVVLGLLFSAIRLWLAHYTNWRIWINSYYDSLYYMRSAINLVSGNWLGAYEKVTLIKNPSFTFFLAINHFLGIPYGIAVALLIIFSCYVFVKAIDPIVKSKVAEFFIWLFIVFSPIGFSEESSYPYRNAIVPWFALLAVSCSIAIFLRYKESIKRLVLWAMLLFFSFGFYYLLREDSIWMLPVIIVSAIITIVLIFKSKEEPSVGYRIAKSILVCSGIFGMLCFVNAVSMLNYHYYGIYSTNDRTQTAAIGVINELKRIDDGKTDKNSNIWISEESMELAFEASPTLNANREQMISSFSSWGTHRDDIMWADHDYCIWALRDATEASGYYQDGRSTIEYYQRVVDELEAAFDNGTLKEKDAIFLSESSGVYYPEDFLHAFNISAASIPKRIDYYSCEMNYEFVDDEASPELDSIEALLGINTVKSDPSLIVTPRDQLINESLSKNLHRSLSLNDITLKIYRIISWISLPLVIIGFILSFTKRKDTVIIQSNIIALALFLTAFLNIYLVEIFMKTINSTVEYVDFYGYTQTATLFIAISGVIGMIHFCRLLKSKVKKV